MTPNQIRIADTLMDTRVVACGKRAFKAFYEVVAEFTSIDRGDLDNLWKKETDITKFYWCEAAKAAVHEYQNFS